MKSIDVILRYSEGSAQPGARGRSLGVPQDDNSSHRLLMSLRTLFFFLMVAPLASADVSFRNDVQPVLTRIGCNSGACHGAAAGKNGFKLSLRGYDPEADYYTLTRQALGRRTELLEPARSLILLKPTMSVAHGGGQRFKVGSPEYQVIAGD